jgi:hypothetical protein
MPSVAPASTPLGMLEDSERRSQTLTYPSSLPLTRMFVLLSSAKHTALTSSWCASTFSVRRPAFTSYTMMLPDVAPATISLPSAEKRMLQMPKWSPRPARKSSVVCSLSCSSVRSMCTNGVMDE